MSGRGGRRPGAGRKPGSRNRVAAEARAEALASGVSPLEFLLEIMRDEQQPLDRRMDAAKAAAPYVHSKPVPLAPPEEPNEPIDEIRVMLIEPAKDRWRPIGETHWRPGLPPEREACLSNHSGSEGKTEGVVNLKADEIK